jgi:hypothetical protein
MREGVGRHEQPEFARPDAEEPHELMPKRHHDHEIDDVRELNRGEHQQQADLAAGTGGTGRRAGSGHESTGERSIVRTRKATVEETPADGRCEFNTAIARPTGAGSPRAGSRVRRRL